MTSATGGSGKRGTVQLDLAKYGLSHLVDKAPHTWPDSEIERLMDAFAAENIAPVIRGLSFSTHNIERLLGLSHCRRCGKCCQPNPITPDHPGAMVYERELKLIAEKTGRSYERLQKNTPMSTDPRYPQRRYLPLPCMFYRKGECQIYDVRPLACKVHPLTDVPGIVGISINVRCDYGKDIYKGLLERMRKGAGTAAKP
jgi:Fe-S-cluster containining protein